MNNNSAKKYLTAMRGKVNSSRESSGRWIYYVFQEELREKFKKILGDDVKPDFALIPNSKIEKGGRRAHNNGDYVLFQIGTDGIPHIIKTSEGKRRRHRNNPNRAFLWDTPEQNGLYGKMIKGKLLPPKNEP